MDSIQQIIKIINDVFHNQTQRNQLIRDFQQSVWNSDEEDWAWEILADLATDLDYYEPDPVLRREDPSYYGDNQLEEKLQSALKKLEDGGICINERKGAGET